MKKIGGIGLLLAVALTLTACRSSNSTNAPSAEAAPTAPVAPPLILTATVPLEGVKGRFDHFASGKGRVFVSGLGNNSVEVIDLFQGTRVHEITGVPNPQGVAFSPEANKLFVASEKGKVYIYDGDSYKLISTLDFEGGADNLRYDAATKRVYVGCGDSEKNAAIAAVDAMTNKRLDEVYKVGGEPESFQLEKNGPNIYVNVPDAKQIVVINRTTKELTRWPVTAAQNFPMALDEADHRLFVGPISPRGWRYLTRRQAGWPLLFQVSRGRTIFIMTATRSESTCRDRRVPTAVGAATAGYSGKQGKGFDRFYLPVASLTLRVDRPKMAVLYIGSSVYKLFTPYPCVLLRLKPWFGCSLGVWNEK